MECKKKIRKADKKYIEYIKSKSCLVCMQTPTDAHHLISRGAGGSDYTCVPLDRKCHCLFHSYGIETFEQLYKVNLWKEAFSLLTKWLGLE